MSSQRFTVTITGLDARDLGKVLHSIPAGISVGIDDVTETWGSARKAVLQNVTDKEGLRTREQILAWAIMFGGYGGPIKNLEDAFGHLIDEGEIVGDGRGHFALGGYDFAKSEQDAPAPTIAVASPPRPMSSDAVYCGPTTAHG